MNCTVNFTPEKTFECPCHHSHFDQQGARNLNACTPASGYAGVSRFRRGHPFRTISKLQESPGDQGVCAFDVGGAGDVVAEAPIGPSWPGGVAAPVRRKCEASQSGADGLVGSGSRDKLPFDLEPPPRRLHQRKLRDIALDVASTPPGQEGRSCGPPMAGSRKPRPIDWQVTLSLQVQPCFKRFFRSTSPG